LANGFLYLANLIRVGVYWSPPASNIQQRHEKIRPSNNTQYRPATYLASLLFTY